MTQVYLYVVKLLRNEENAKQLIMIITLLFIEYALAISLSFALLKMKALLRKTSFTLTSTAAAARCIIRWKT
jgi:hypothetical protein